MLPAPILLLMDLRILPRGGGGVGGGGIRPRPTPQNVSEESEVNHSSVTDKRWASSTLNVLPFSLVEI